MDEFEFKNNKKEEEKLKLLEERYKPRKYTNIEIRPPTPKLNPSKLRLQHSVSNAVFDMMRLKKFDLVHPI